MSHESQNTQSSKQGMTLLEVILAIAVAGFLLTAATSLVTSLSSIWMSRQDRNFFDDHADGVAEFIRASFQQAGTEIALESDSNGTATNTGGQGDNPGGDFDPEPNIQPPVRTPTSKKSNTGKSSSGGLLRVSETPIAWGRPPNYPNYAEPMLSFAYQNPPPLLSAGDAAPSSIQAYLYFDESEGLSLLWYSTLQEEIENPEDLYHTAISPLVSDLQYQYWDADFERWEIKDEPEKDESGDSEDYLLPQALIIHFSKEDETISRTITIPITSRSALIF